MTDKYVESTYQQLIDAYKNADKVYDWNKLDYYDSGLSKMLILQPLDI